MLGASTKQPALPKGSQRGVNMARKSTTTTTTRETPCAAFKAVQQYVRKYHAIAHDDPAATDIATIHAMGTWTFSPACPARPYTYPYLWWTGPYGSGKSLAGRDVFGKICRMPQQITLVTGPALFRLMGDYDPETGDVTNNYPTLVIDEWDATLQAEGLRGVMNEGYAEGAMIPRTMGKTGSVRFPVYGPKVIIGADNGHMPASIETRLIRIDCEKHSQGELDAMGIEPMYPWIVDTEQTELSQMLDSWAKENAMTLREYEPKPVEGLAARQWTMCRSIIQLARAAGIENRIRKSLKEVLSRQPEKIDARIEMYTAIFEVFEDNDTTKATTKMLLGKLRESGIPIPGGSGKGLASVLAGDNISPTYLRIDDPGHPGYVEGKTTHRGYHRYQFDQAFVSFLPDLDEDDA